MQQNTSPAGNWHACVISHGRWAKHIASYSTKPGQAALHSSIKSAVGPIVCPDIGAVVSKYSGAAVVVCSTAAAVVAGGVVNEPRGALVVPVQDASHA